MKERMVCTAVIVLVASVGRADVPPPELKPKPGTVRATTVADGRIRVFKGTPTPPRQPGEFRWKEPRPAAPWTGVKDATQFGAQCVQGPIFGDITVPGPHSEDCLNLNLWTRARKAATSCPSWSGSTPAGSRPPPAPSAAPRRRRLRQEGRGVLVTSNYRLGIFGLLVHAS